LKRKHSDELTSLRLNTVDVLQRRLDQEIALRQAAEQEANRYLQRYRQSEQTETAADRALRAEREALLKFLRTTFEQVCDPQPHSFFIEVLSKRLKWYCVV
jgi:hypothetical protein